LKIIIASDFHGNIQAIEGFALEAKKEDVDLSIICGDITNFGTNEQAKTMLSYMEKTDSPVLYVPGNCDPKDIVNFSTNKIKCIHEKNAYYNNIEFIGIGGSHPTPFNTPFELSENKIMNKLSMSIVRRKTNLPLILVSHSPPKNTVADKTFSGAHVGSISIRHFIEKNKPLAVFCGHIHESKGVEKIDETTIVNPGAGKDRNYIPTKEQIKHIVQRRIVETKNGY